MRRPSLLLLLVAMSSATAVPACFDATTGGQRALDAASSDASLDALAPLDAPTGPDTPDAASADDTGDVRPEETTLPPEVSVEDVPPPSDAPVDAPSAAIEAACATDAEAYCNKLSSCSPRVLEWIEGSLARCNARAKLQCIAAAAGRGTARTPTTIEACAAATTDQSCEDFWIGLPSPCEPPRGTLAVGEGCGDDAQCSSGFCNVLSSVHCGKCAARPEVGAKCLSNRCAFGLVCGNGTCRKGVAPGAKCDADTPCRIDLACYKGACVPFRRDGQPCDPLGFDEPDCDVSRGFACEDGRLRCKPMSVVKIGSRCTTLDLTKPCEGGSSCVSSICVRNRSEGEPCTPGKEPTCSLPSKCVPGGCAYPDFALCK